MNYRKKQLTWFGLLLSVVGLMMVSFLVLTPVSADFATEIDKQTKAFAGKEGAGFAEKQSDPRVVAAQIIQFLLGFVGTLFFVYTVYAGYLLMTSAGEEDKVSKAKSTIRTGILGILITLSAYAITTMTSNIILQATRGEQDGWINVIFRVQRDDRLRNVNQDPLAPPATTPYDQGGRGVLFPDN